MEPHSPLRVKIPCNDERDFYARLADHVAARGLRVPTEEQRPIGTRLQVALEFRNGRTLLGHGVVDAHVQLDSRSGVNVRILRFDPDGGGPVTARPPPLPGSPARAASAPPGSSGAGPAGAPARSAANGSLEDELFVEVDDAAPDAPIPAARSLTSSGEIVAMMGRRAARFQRAALAAIAAAVVLGAAAWALLHRQPVTPEAVAAARVQAADRLMSEGRIIGRDGALEQLLAAKRLRPEDPATNQRLSRLADMLETLGARALERGDLPVASIHLEGALAAAPDRASIRAKLEALDKKKSPDAAREKRTRKATDRRKR